jgi:hypothetical protein
MGCHIVDTPYLALGLGSPVSVRARVEPAWRDTPARRGETWPTWQVVRYTFPGNKLTAGKTIELIWSDGDKYPPDHVRQHCGGRAFPKQGSLLVGEAGSLLLPHGGGAMPLLFPAEKFKGFPRPQIAPRNHYAHWIDACRGKARTAAGFDYAGPLTEVILLGTVALRCPDKELAWDAEQMKVTNLAAADQYIRPPSSRLALSPHLPVRRTDRHLPDAAHADYRRQLHHHGLGGVHRPSLVSGPPTVPSVDTLLRRRFLHVASS